METMGFRVAFLALGAALAGSTAMLGLTMAAWHRTTGDMVARMRAGVVPKPGTFTAQSVEQLPPPVARYFRRALTEGQPLIVSAIATQEAEFRANGAWKPLRATQHFTIMPPGFLWDARIRMAPLMPALVRDAYIEGRGLMQATMFGVFPLVNQAAFPELNAGALQRYLGEAVWLPTALLPGHGVTWTPIDDRSATATLVDGGASVSLRFHFDDRDDIVEVSGHRFAEHQGQYELRPWHVRCFDHVKRNGMTIPQSCEVAWISKKGAEPYWRGRIASIEYDFAK
jgi:hypothetical protein